jgi:hypothetical protein
MNANTLFKLWFESTYPTGEIVEIDGKSVYRTGKLTIYYDIEKDKTYKQIQHCINNRNTYKKPLFSCTCGICNAYLMTQLYNSTIKKNSETILDEVLNEMVSNSTHTTPIQSYTDISIKTPTVKPHPLDMMVLTFGKHKGKTYKEAFSSDKEYCIWCIESMAAERSKGSRINDTMLAFVGYIKQRISNL